MKRIIGFAFVIFMLLDICAFMTVSADTGVYTHHIRINDYTTETYNVILSLPEGKTAPKGGLQLVLYFGTGDNKSTGGSGGEKIKYLGYHGADLKEVPPDSDVYKTNGINISKREYVTIAAGQSRAEVPMDITVRSKYGNSGASGKTMYIGWYMCGDYMGGARECLYTEKTTYNITVDGYKSAEYISGMVNMPGGSPSCRIIAEADRIADGMNISRKYVFSTLVAANSDTAEQEAEFSLAVLPGYEYTVYTVFDGEEYIRQYTTVKVPLGKQNIRFADFRKSHSVKGVLKLPDGFDEFVTVDGRELNDVRGQIVLQDAQGDHGYLDYCIFALNGQSGEYEFELRDGIGAQEYVLYYEVFDEVRGLYGGGNYKNDGETSPSVKDAAIVLPDSNVVLKMAEGNTIKATVRTGVNHPDFELMALIQDGGEPDIYENVSLAVGSYSRNEYEENGVNYRDYYYTLPKGRMDYTLQIEPYRYEGVTLYSTGDGCSKSIEDSKYFSSDEPSIGIAYDGYTEDTPLLISDASYSANNGQLTVNIANEYECAYEGDILCYAILKDGSGRISGTSGGRIDSISGGETKTARFDIARDDYAAAAELRVFAWGSNLLPMSRAYVDSHLNGN